MKIGRKKRYKIDKWSVLTCKQVKQARHVREESMVRCVSKPWMYCRGRRCISRLFKLENAAIL